MKPQKEKKKKNRLVGREEGGGDLKASRTKGREYRADRYIDCKANYKSIKTNFCLADTQMLKV